MNRFSHGWVALIIDECNRVAVIAAGRSPHSAWSGLGLDRIPVPVPREDEYGCLVGWRSVAGRHGGKRRAVVIERCGVPGLVIGDEFRY